MSVFAGNLNQLLNLVITECEPATKLVIADYKTSFAVRALLNTTSIEHTGICVWKGLETLSRHDVAKQENAAAKQSTKMPSQRQMFLMLRPSKEK